MTAEERDELLRIMKEIRSMLLLMLADQKFVDSSEAETARKRLLDAGIITD